MFNEREASSERFDLSAAQLSCGLCYTGLGCRDSFWRAAYAMAALLHRFKCARLDVWPRTNCRLGGHAWKKQRCIPAPSPRLAEASEALGSPLPASCIAVARVLLRSCRSRRPERLVQRILLRPRHKAVKSSIAAAHTHRTDAVDALPAFSGSPAAQRSRPRYGNHPHRWPTSWPRRPRRL